MPREFKILFVCTGNICRSPMAAILLSNKIRKPGIKIDSAGTHALRHSDMPPQSKQVLDELGIPTSEHISKQLDPELLEDADLVLTATAEQRSEAARTLVRANRYTFTILEFADIIDFLKDPGETDFDILEEGPTLHERLRQVAAARGYLNSEKDRDIEDPFTHEINVYRQVGDQINEATRKIAEWINI